MAHNWTIIDEGFFTFFHSLSPHSVDTTNATRRNIKILSLAIFNQFSFSRNTRSNCWWHRGSVVLIQVLENDCFESSEQQVAKIKSYKHKCRGKIASIVFHHWAERQGQSLSHITIYGSLCESPITVEDEKSWQNEENKSSDKISWRRPPPT